MSQEYPFGTVYWRHDSNILMPFKWKKIKFIECHHAWIGYLESKAFHTIYEMLKRRMKKNIMTNFIPFCSLEVHQT